MSARADGSGAAVTTDVVAALLHQRAWPAPGGPVQLHETHVSWLFFVGERVYKLKKPVHLPFLDFSTLERRRHFCEEELRLNRRLAPDVYLGVLPVTRGPDGALAVGAEGEVVDHVVAMRRLPAESMLDVALERGAIDNDLLRQLAALLARFHEQAATGPGVDEHGSPEAVRRLLLGNLDELVATAGEAGWPAPSAVAAGHLRRWLLAFLERHRGLLAARVRRGRIREGHGDLHAGNICCTPAGPVAFDALEFSHELRCADVAADLAFLAMDLDHRACRAFARFLCREYANAACDRGLPFLMDVYKLHRALVRAKVACLSPDEDRQQRAASYLALALGYTLPPSLLLMCGLPASGKTWMARHLAPPLDALVLRSDVLRKRLLGVPPTEHPAPQEAAALYAAGHTAATYRALRRSATDALQRGRSVVVDATFAAREERRRLVDAAVRLGHPVVVVQTLCPPEVVRERMQRRRQDAREVSDADWEVYSRAALVFEPPHEQPAVRRVDVGVGEAPETCVLAVMERIIAQIGGATTPAVQET